MSDSKEFALLAEKTLPWRVKPDLVAYCPTMDILALATREERVYMYRLNGQRVLTATNKDHSLEVNKMHWKPDGQLTAIAWSDNVVRLLSPESNKVIHQISVSSVKGIRICCLGWAINFTNGSAVQARVQEKKENLDDILSHAARIHAPDVAPDLPRDLELLDIETALPKLSVLPSGKDEDIFSSRASVDAMFHSSRRMEEEEAVDVLVAGLDDGQIHLSIYNCFQIGIFDLGTVSAQLKRCRSKLHASHPYSSTHALLVTSALDERPSIIFVPVDLRFISASGGYLSLLAAKSTQLQNLLRYISQVYKLVEAAWKSCQDLPTKFMRNISEVLRERYQCDFVQAAYHLVVTGNCLPPVKEWLVDELSERGHKRWEKAVTVGYETIRRLVHESLLPALERCVIIVSRLRGLSKYGECETALGLSTKHLNGVLDAITCLSLLAHSVLNTAGTELRQFAAFSTWLRNEIDIQATDPATSTADPAEKEVDIEYGKVLDYIQGAMINSELADFILRSSSRDRSSLPGAHNASALSEARTDLKQIYSACPSETQPPCLGDMIIHLESQCALVFQGIAEAQKRNVLFGAPFELTTSDNVDACDMRMLSEHNTPATYIAIKDRGQMHSICLLRIVLHIENGISSTGDADVAYLSLGSGEIRDVKFVDDDFILVLWHGEDFSTLLSIPYNKSAGRLGCLSYRNYAQTLKEQGLFNRIPAFATPSKESIDSYVRYSFPSGPFSPYRIEVNGRKGRRVVCVLSQDEAQYKVLDLGSDTDETTGHGDGEDVGRGVAEPDSDQEMF